MDTIKKKTIAILYFCSGPYGRYWDEFYISTQKYFLPNIEKHYFVWTDRDIQKSPNITHIYQESLGWPNHTLHRFRMFLSQQKQLKTYDYIVFFNANIKCVQMIRSEDFLPSVDQNYMALEHFSYYQRLSVDFPYDRNPVSSAYIPTEKGQHYFLGALNGGMADAYLNLCEVCDNWIREDESRGILPRWFDESILNKFLLDRDDIRVLDISYGYPEAAWFPKFTPKIVSISKEIFVGSKDKLRKGGQQKIHIGRWLYVHSLVLWKQCYYGIQSIFSK